MIPFSHTIKKIVITYRISLDSKRCVIEFHGSNVRKSNISFYWFCLICFLRGNIEKKTTLLFRLCHTSNQHTTRSDDDLVSGSEKEKIKVGSRIEEEEGRRADTFVKKKINSFASSKCLRICVRVCATRYSIYVVSEVWIFFYFTSSLIQNKIWMC